MKRSFERIRDAMSEALRVKFPHGGCCACGVHPCGTGWYIEATFEDAVIVRHGAQLIRFEVEFDKAGKATVGDGKPVEVAYQALKEAVGGRILAPIIEEGATATGKPGSKWLVCVIQEGMSQNRIFYSAEVLREAAPLYEGAKVFWNHAQKSLPNMVPMRDPRDITGYLTGPKFATLALEADKAKAQGAILATLHATTKDMRERLLEAHEAGNPGLFGLSHTVAADAERVRLNDGPAARVKRIQVVESVDIVSFPSAGGRVMRLVAGLTSPVPWTEEDLQMLDKKIAKLREARPDLAAKLSATPTETEVDGLLMEAVLPKPAEAPPAQPPAPAPVAAPPAPAPAVTATETISVSEARQLRKLAHTFAVDQALTGRTMAEPLKVMLRESLMERIGLSEAEIKAEVDRAVATSAKLQEPAPVGSGLGRPAVGASVTNDEATKYLESIEAFFFHDADEKVRREYKKEYGKDCPKGGPNSLKEIYAAGTGDNKVTGKFREAQGLARYQRLMEGVSAYFQEAIGTGTLSNAFASSMNRRLLSEFRAAEVYQKWRRLVSRIQPLADFRNQERVRWGHFGDLPIVAQSGTYTELADPTDEKVTYAPAKRGAIVSITREAIKNDDVGIVRQIPQRLALSAARTIHKFVTDFIVTNPTLDDGVALFAAAATRGASSAGNLQTAALSTTTVGIARQRLLKVQDKDAKTTLGLGPKLLIVPPELEELAIRLTSIPVYPVSGQNATEPNIIAEKYGLNEYMVLETMADANDWFIVADPRIVDLIEMGFVDGQEEPMILVQDQELVGSVFSSDKWSFKVRHEYGGDVVEWRGTQGGLVA